LYPVLYFHPERVFMPTASSVVSALDVTAAAQRVVVIGTGGTIAGAAASAHAHLGYKAGALAAQDLVASVPALQGQDLEVQSLVQMDSCDMDHATWLKLARAVERHLARPEVAGVVITHGTDTLEETALFLHLTVRADKPVVMTAAMRPSTAPSPDGPQNLVDAVTVARTPGARGVVAVLAGQVLAGNELRKVHGYRVEAFTTGDAPPLALVQDGKVLLFRAWPQVQPLCPEVLAGDAALWPVVDIVTSHAGARGQTLDALVQAGARGIIIAGSGNGSVHAGLLQAARRAQAQGVVVRRASRCVLGGVVGARADTLPTSGALTPAQARVQLLLELVAGLDPRPAST
jgi:L-asparaginase